MHKSLKALILLALIGGSGAYIAVDQRHVVTSNNERLFNDKLYAAQLVEQKSKWFNQPITEAKRDYALVHTDSGSALKAVKRIANYTVKIQTPCSSGTAWFLDYEIPEDNNKYPTKWFIATNAHVVSDYAFRSNPYKQLLPVGVLQAGCVARYGESTEVFLMKDYNIDHNTLNLTSSLYADLAGTRVRNVEEVIKQAAWNAKDGDPKHGNYNFVYSKLKEPKLFYVPTNFLGSKYSSIGLVSWNKVNYLRDFAVLEVNFESEQEAKNLTQDFYNKRKKNEAEELDLFAPELLSSKSIDEIVKNETDYFWAGYPGSRYDRLFKYSLTSNYSNHVAQKVGKLIGIHDNDDKAVRNSSDQVIPGHYQGDLTFRWRGDEYRYWGYEYAIANIPEIGPGASGSLMTDAQGKVLGIVTSAAISSHTPAAFVTPLRSEGLIIDSQIIFPKYDLINGSEWQIGSYREQLDTYFPNLKTYLRENKWKKSNQVAVSTLSMIV